MNELRAKLLLDFKDNKAYIFFYECEKKFCDKFFPYNGISKAYDDKYYFYILDLNNPDHEFFDDKSKYKDIFKTQSIYNDLIKNGIDNELIVESNKIKLYRTLNIYKSIYSFERYSHYLRIETDKLKGIIPEGGYIKIGNINKSNELKDIKKLILNIVDKIKDIYNKIPDNLKGKIIRGLIFDGIFIDTGLGDVYIQIDNYNMKYMIDSNKTDNIREFLNYLTDGNIENVKENKMVKFYNFTDSIEMDIISETKYNKENNELIIRYLSNDVSKKMIITYNLDRKELNIDIDERSIKDGLRKYIFKNISLGENGQFKRKYNIDLINDIFNTFRKINHMFKVKRDVLPKISDYISNIFVPDKIVERFSLSEYINNNIMDFSDVDIFDDISNPFYIQNPKEYINWAKDIILSEYKRILGNHIRNNLKC